MAPQFTLGFIGAGKMAGALAAVREQLGLELSLQRRSVPILIVEKAELSK